MDNYPLGSVNDPNAPWNEEDIPTQQYQVLVNADLIFQIEAEGEYNSEGYFEVNDKDLKTKIVDKLQADDKIVDYKIIDIE